MFCICKSSNGISIRIESTSEDQKYVVYAEATRLYAEAWWPESAPKQIHSDSDQRHLYQVIKTLKRYQHIQQRRLWSVTSYSRQN